MVLVTLGDCHHLDGLVVVCLRCEARKKIVRCSREVMVRGIVLTPPEPQRATCGPIGSSARACGCGKYSTWGSWSWGRPRGSTVVATPFGEAELGASAWLRGGGDTVLRGKARDGARHREWRRPELQRESERKGTGSGGGIKNG